MTDSTARGPLASALLFLLLGLGSFVAGLVGLVAAFVLWLVALDRAARLVPGMRGK
jgi:hypothetical protein